MLSSPNRLRKDKDIKLVLSKGKTLIRGLCLVKYYLPRQAVRPRFTVVISVKVEKRAVVRNRFKRVVREFLKKTINFILPGDYIIILKKGATLPKAEEKVLSELKTIFSKNV